MGARAKNHEPQKPQNGINTAGFAARKITSKQRNKNAKKARRKNRKK